MLVNNGPLFVGQVSRDAWLLAVQRDAKICDTGPFSLYADARRPTLRYEFILVDLPDRDSDSVTKAPIGIM